MDIRSFTQLFICSILLPPSPSSLSYLEKEFDSASIFCGDLNNLHSCAIFDRRWKETPECRRLDACVKMFWHENVLPTLATKAHTKGMNFVFIPMTRSFGGGSIPRHELTGRVTSHVKRDRDE